MMRMGDNKILSNNRKEAIFDKSNQHTNQLDTILRAGSVYRLKNHVHFLLLVCGHLFISLLESI